MGPFEIVICFDSNDFQYLVLDELMEKYEFDIYSIDTNLFDSKKNIDCWPMYFLSIASYNKIIIYWDKLEGNIVQCMEDLFYTP